MRSLRTVEPLTTRSEVYSFVGSRPDVEYRASLSLSAGAWDSRTPRCATEIEATWPVVSWLSKVVLKRLAGRSSRIPEYLW